MKNQNQANYSQKRNGKPFGKQQVDDLGSINFGKIPPQAIDMEEAVLGAMMLESRPLISVISKLRAEMFYKDGHRVIFNAISSIFSRGDPVDILTVTDQLRKDETLEVAGGPYYVTMLTNRIGSTANIEFHAAIVIQKYISREGIRIASLFANELYEDSADVFDSFSDAQVSLMSLMNEVSDSSTVKVSELFSPTVQKIRELFERKIEYIGIPSGIMAYDDVTLGFQNTTLSLIASRPGMGKTALLISMARCICKNKIPVGVFELEMSREQLMNRLISAETSIDYRALTSGKIERNQMDEVEGTRKFFESMPLFIECTGNLTLLELRTKCIDMVSSYKCEIIFIDYIQLIRASIRGRSREEEVSEISKGLKQIAKELDISIVALAQLSREAERRANKRPELSDLRESGSLEQDADIVTFIFRPGYYGFSIDNDGFPLKEGHTELIIAKHRSGPTGEIPCIYKETLMRFEDTEDYVSSLNPLPKYTQLTLDTDITQNQNAPF